MVTSNEMVVEILEMIVPLSTKNEKISVIEIASVTLRVYYTLVVVVCVEINLVR